MVVNFSKRLEDLPPEGKAIIDELFSRWLLIQPEIYNFLKPRNLGLTSSPESMMTDIIIGWNFPSFTLEFWWTQGRGYEWFAKDRISGEHGESERYSESPIPPESVEWILRFFPQDLNMAVFNLASLKRIV